MSVDIENVPNIANIHRIRSIKNNRPTTALTNKATSNKQFVNILKRGNFELEKKILDVNLKIKLKLK
jgi:hypothetical protein